MHGHHMMMNMNMNNNSSRGVGAASTQLKPPRGVVRGRTTMRSRGVMTTQSIFKTLTKRKESETTTKNVVVEKKRGLFGRTSSTVSKKTPQVKTIDKASEYKKRQGLLGSVVGSFDFAEVRSKSDAELLYDAKYGKLQGGKMTREQYQALRRKVGGTAKDYWKDWVDVKGEYTDKGYVSEDTNGVVGLPFLLAVVVALLGTAAYVVSQTS